MGLRRVRPKRSEGIFFDQLSLYHFVDHGLGVTAMRLDRRFAEFQGLEEIPPISGLLNRDLAKCCYGIEDKVSEKR